MNARTFRNLLLAGVGMVLLAVALPSMSRSIASLLGVISQVTRDVILAGTGR